MVLDKIVTRAVKALLVKTYNPLAVFDGDNGRLRLTVVAQPCFLCATFDAPAWAEPLQFDGAAFGKALPASGAPFTFDGNRLTIGEGATRVPLLPAARGTAVMDVRAALAEAKEETTDETPRAPSPWAVAETLRLSPAFLRALAQVAPAMAGEDNRYGLNLLRIEPYRPCESLSEPELPFSAIRLVATDGNRLHAAMLVEAAQLDSPITLPRAIVAALVTLPPATLPPAALTLTATAQRVRVEVERQVGAHSADYTLSLIARCDRRETAANFPDWSQVMPSGTPFATCCFATEPLREACAALGKRAKEDCKMLCFTFPPDRAVLEAGPLGERTDVTLPCGHDAAEAVEAWVVAQREVAVAEGGSSRKPEPDAEQVAMRIAAIEAQVKRPLVAFNAHLLRDVCDALSDGVLELELRGKPGAMLSPCLVRERTAEGALLCVIMPVRMD